MTTLTITLARSPYSYPIHIEPQCLNKPLASRIQTALPKVKKLLVVTHPTLWDMFGHTLDLTGFNVYVHTVPEGEPTKSLDHLNGIWLAAQQASITRKDAFVALGGGVIGDLTGFAAATYYRGVPFVQIPTTLLAQVDSSVGGKTGINVGPVKNSVGVFNQPALVVIDPAVLDTLPERELTAGLAEVVKYGLIETTCMPTGEQSASFWNTLAGYADRPSLMVDIADIIHTCCTIKASVVMQDETEQLGLRAVLNLGHTFGHALEADGQYTTYLHGEAVAIGTLWACQFATSQGMLPPDMMEAVLRVWQRLGLPTRPRRQHTADDLLARIRQDKKNDSTDVITLILPTSQLGRVTVHNDVPISAIHQFLTQQLAAHTA